MSRWDERDDVQRGADYDRRWAAMAAAGQSVHGEADLVESLLRDAGAETGRVLDAGCGTGRVAIELARRGVRVVGADLDPAMLAEARAKAPSMEWVQADLTDLTVDGEIDLVLLAGNVMIFLTPDTEQVVIANMARHLRPGGLLVSGFQTGAGRLAPATYDRIATDHGLEAVDHWSTWQRDPHTGGDYSVMVHRRV